MASRNAVSRQARGSVSRLPLCDLVALARNQECQEALLGARKTGHVGVLGDIGTVSLVAVVRDVEADFVQLRRPDQYLFGQRRRQLPFCVGTLNQ